MFFYAHDGLISSTNQVWLQWVFDIIIGIFDKFGIINNVAIILEMSVSCAGHLTPIVCGIFLTSNGPRMTHHLQNIFHISYNPKLIKEANYYIKYPLRPHMIVGVN